MIFCNCKKKDKNEIFVEELEDDKRELELWLATLLKRKCVDLDKLSLKKDDVDFLEQIIEYAIEKYKPSNNPQIAILTTSNIIISVFAGFLLTNFFKVLEANGINWYSIVYTIATFVSIGSTGLIYNRSKSLMTKLNKNLRKLALLKKKLENCDYIIIEND